MGRHWGRAHTVGGAPSFEVARLGVVPENPAVGASPAVDVSTPGGPVSHARSVGVPLCVVLGLAAALVSLGACGDGGAGASCVEPSRCSASPIGAWQRASCEPWERLRFSTDSATGAARACEVALDDARVAETDRFDVAADGTYTRAWSARGPWSGLVDPACLAAIAASCEDLAAEVGYGASSCEATGDGCRCAGTLDLDATTSGEWRTGSGQIVLEDDDGEETFTLCSDERVMRLDPAGGRSRHYRPYIAPPGAR